MGFDVTSNLTKDQLESFYLMKGRITELYGDEEAEDDPRLLRFLIARDFDAERGAEMLSNDIKWRRKYGINDILKTYQMNEVLDKYYITSLLGFSKDGDTIIIGVAKYCDMIGISKSITTADFIMYTVHRIEKDNELLRKKSEEDGRLYQSWIFIVDVDKLPLPQVTNKSSMDMFSMVLPIYEAHYPERMKTIYIINASMTFTVGYSLLKSFFNEKTRNKFKVFGKTGWKEELLKVIDADVLPAYMGGNRTDPDGNPMCNTIIRRPGPVPEMYYKGKAEKNIAMKPGVRKCIVSRRSRIAIKLEVPEPDLRIEWEFQTENYDIGFGLEYVSKKNNNDTETLVEDVLIPIQKMQTKVFSETGTYLCERPGTYKIIFDNSYSWLRSKELYVRAETIIPDGQTISQKLSR